MASFQKVTVSASAAQKGISSRSPSGDASTHSAKATAYISLPHELRARIHVTDATANAVRAARESAARPRARTPLRAG
jgi:prophage tail gpP-like protein